MTFRIWEPPEWPYEHAWIMEANTAKQVAVSCLEGDYQRRPRSVKKHVLHVERIFDGARWVIELEPVVVTTWRTNVVASPTPLPKGLEAPAEPPVQP